MKRQSERLMEHGGDRKRCLGSTVTRGDLLITRRAGNKVRRGDIFRINISRQTGDRFLGERAMTNNEGCDARSAENEN